MSSLVEKPDAMSAEVMAATIAGLQAERAEMAAKVASLEESLTDLAHENALLKRRLFGSKTERFRTSELQLALGDLLAAEAKLQADLDASVEKAKDAAPTPDPSEGKGKARPHGRRNLFASNLPRVPVEICDPALEACGARLIRFEDSAQLAFRRGEFFVVVKRVAQYEVVEDSVATVVPAAPPETLFPKALLHTSTVAHILTSKFALGVSHYRLERDLLDQGMRLDRGLMSRYVKHATSRSSSARSRSSTTRNSSGPKLVGGASASNAARPFAYRMKRLACRRDPALRGAKPNVPTSAPTRCPTVAPRTCRRRGRFLPSPAGNHAAPKAAAGARRRLAA